MPMNIHCKSGNDDLGQHIVPSDQNYTWSFYPNIWDSTLYFYWIQWVRSDGKQVSGDFDIYRESREVLKCRDRCVWYAKNDGIYFRYNWKVPDHMQLMYQWPN
ncbi:hypothetical protein GIB67_004601 [Kingdonia uniflora]|uniref:S-protein homolog n=1 Tax=Kingdonia uniflora TaxID=39325 RepID=A0A7J7MD66_9MAGN|nr:hypothetical protein GIB67_004601 [Kingdonia uniflora]